MSVPLDLLGMRGVGAVGSGMYEKGLQRAAEVVS